MGTSSTADVCCGAFSIEEMEDRRGRLSLLIVEGDGEERSVCAWERERLREDGKGERRAWESVSEGTVVGSRLETGGN